MEKENEKDNGIYVDIRFIYIRRNTQIDIQIYICVCSSYAFVNIYVCRPKSYDVKHVDVKHVDSSNKQWRSKQEQSGEAKH